MPLLSLGLFGFAVLSSFAVRAHHAFVGNYDLDLYDTIEGVVDEVAWSNPHVHYYLSVTRADGSTELWDVETMNVNTLVRLGWTRDSIRVGDVVKVSGNLGLNGRRRISADVFVKADGTVLSPRPSRSGD